MASIELIWDAFIFDAKAAPSWAAFKKLVNQKLLKEAINPRSVYVVRICKPFAIRYEKSYSPVVYIGRGRFKSRIASHIKSWIHPLSEHIPDLKIEIMTCKPRAKALETAYKDVEADLINRFVAKYGEKPLKNKRLENHKHNHKYNQGAISRAIGKGKGPGFYWSLSPIGSSPLEPDLKLVDRPRGP
jgi:hypothetical protein